MADQRDADQIRDNQILKPVDQLADPFRVFVDNQVDLICTYMPDGVLIYANFAYATFFGTTPSDLLGTCIVELAPEDARSSAQESLETTVAAFRESTRSTSNEFGLKNSDGELKWIEWTDQAVLGPDGELFVITAVGRDVSDRHHAQHQLLEMNQMLAESNRDLEDFAYVASHDLQEPLRKIIAFSGRLSDKAGPELSDKNLDYLNRISSAAGRMQSLIDDLLEVSRVTTAGSALVPVDLETVLAEVVSDLEIAIERAGATVAIQAPLPTVPADETQMRQLFQNLIGNALKFRSEGVSPVVTIDVSELKKDDLPPLLRPLSSTFVRISVSDNGIGFDDQHAEKIFTIFQRLHGRTDYEGSGIGLSVCKKIVDRHGGDITAQSEPGNGATFDVILPLA